MAMERRRQVPEVTISPRLLKIGIPIIVVILVIAALVSQTVVIVDSGYRGVVLTWGAVDTDIVFDEGLHFVVPIQQRVVQVNVQILKEEAKTTAASKDLQDVSTEVTLNYHINPDRANVVYQQLRQESTERIVRPAIQEAVKSSTAQFTAEDLIVRRALVKDMIDSEMAEWEEYNS